MKISGWGRYSVIDANVYAPRDHAEWIAGVAKTPSLIPRGLGRSYGDSADNQIVFSTNQYDHFVSFDKKNGLLVCESGVTLSEILRLIVSEGWFLPVTPGTRFVTIGGAIAADVHGKNHHLSGTFTEHVASIELLLGTGEIVTVSKTHLPELFHATCGGMGLTGVILSASIKLIPIYSSSIKQKTIKAKCLEEIIELFQENHTSEYSAAWIDCMATGSCLGRSLLFLGEHVKEGSLDFKLKNKMNVPFNMPEQLLNRFSIKMFNALYYAKRKKAMTEQVIPFESCFYPLDAIKNWNRLYGRHGFVQYQFVLPKDISISTLKKILSKIAASGSGSFLAVLKMLGKSNKNLLSFPMEGYTLALDFKVNQTVLQLIPELDELVLAQGGRIYLAKDALMSEQTFKNSYTQWETFENIRAQYGAFNKFSSCQSRRLGLHC